MKICSVSVLICPDLASLVLLLPSAGTPMKETEGGVEMANSKARGEAP
jgi:hypothetical protein